MKKNLLLGVLLLVCAIAVGWPANDEQPKDKWKPERIHYERW
jgi:hypothetical protein